METFKYDFKNKDGSINIDKMYGYQLALNEVFSHIKNETNFNPVNRHIDSLPLLERISATNFEIYKLLNSLSETGTLKPHEFELLVDEKRVKP